jgi:hypothetical protein
LFNGLQFRRRLFPGVVSTRSLTLTVETTLLRRTCKAWRLNAAALQAPLDGAPRLLSAGRRQRRFAAPVLRCG